MLIVLSPAKTLDLDSPVPVADYTLPDLRKRALELVELLRACEPARLASMMAISDRLAAENAARFQAFSSRFTSRNSRQSVFTFNGDVYQGLGAQSLNRGAIDWLQKHVRILSGLYGVLRPLDLMQPYRLEMGTRLQNPAGSDLYAYWGETIARKLAVELKQSRHRVLINLASDEYFRAVDLDALNLPVIQPIFQESRGGAWKFVSFSAKRARGLMARYAAERNLQDPRDLLGFDYEGYRHDPRAGDEFRWYFRREEPQD